MEDIDPTGGGHIFKPEASNMAVPAKWEWPSTKPGIRVFPYKFINSVFSPIKARIYDILCPTAIMVPYLMPTKAGYELSDSMVIIGPL